MKVRPLADNVLLCRVDEETVSSGGIVIPDAAKQKPDQGVVLDIGDEVKNVKTGELVLFEQHSGSEVKVGDNTLLILKEENIVAVLSEDES